MTDFQTYKGKDLVQMKIHANQLHQIALLARAVLDSMGPSFEPDADAVSALENALKFAGYPAYRDVVLGQTKP